MASARLGGRGRGDGFLGAGSPLGYLIGMFACAAIGEPILRSLGKADAMASFDERFDGVGFRAVLVAGVTPFPYKVVTLVPDWTAMPPTTFLVPSAIARALRFFVVAGLPGASGPPILAFVERRPALAFPGFVAARFAGFAAIGSS